MTAARVARARAGRPLSLSSPRPPGPPPPPAVGRGRASSLTSVRGSEDGCGAEHRAVAAAAAAAAGGERSWRGLRLARGALSREARRRRGRVGGLGDRSAQPIHSPQHHGQRGGRSQRETAVEREKGGKVGRRTPGGLGPCRSGREGGKVRAHSPGRVLSGPGRGRGPGLPAASIPLPDVGSAPLGPGD